MPSKNKTLAQTIIPKIRVERALNYRPSLSGERELLRFEVSHFTDMKTT